MNNIFHKKDHFEKDGFTIRMTPAHEYLLQKES
jgi:hypothetical protein